MLKIRLQRHGAKHAPYYRMVVTEVTAPRDGRFIEILGTYDPQCRAKENELKLKMERIDHWLGVGAQPTDTARSLIRQGRLDSEAWLARAEKRSQSKATRRLKGSLTAPSMDESTSDAPTEGNSPAADEVAEASVDAPVAAVDVQSDPSPGEDPASEDSSVGTSEDQAAEESAASEDEPKVESSDAPAADDDASSTADEASAENDISDEAVAAESSSNDETEAEAKPVDPPEADDSSDSPKESSAKDDTDTPAVKESETAAEEEKSKD
jgi:small subunit ribosomal protein S16